MTRSGRADSTRILGYEVEGNTLRPSTSRASSCAGVWAALSAAFSAFSKASTRRLYSTRSGMARISFPMSWLAIASCSASVRLPNGTGIGCRTQPAWKSIERHGVMTSSGQPVAMAGDAERTRPAARAKGTSTGRWGRWLMGYFRHSMGERAIGEVGSCSAESKASSRRGCVHGALVHRTWTPVVAPASASPRSHVPRTFMVGGRRAPAKRCVAIRFFSFHLPPPRTRADTTPSDADRYLSRHARTSRRYAVRTRLATKYPSAPCRCGRSRPDVAPPKTSRATSDAKGASANSRFCSRNCSTTASHSSVRTLHVA